MFTTESLQPSLHQLTTPPPNSNLDLTLCFFFSQTHVSGGVINNILVSKICITFNLNACSSILFVNIS